MFSNYDKNFNGKRLPPMLLQFNFQNFKFFHNETTLDLSVAEPSAPLRRATDVKKKTNARRRY